MFAGATEKQKSLHSSTLSKNVQKCVTVFGTTGTASAVMWTLRVNGRLFHSGLPHKGINSLELAMEAIAYIQNKFYQEYPPVSLARLSDEFGSVKMAAMMFSLFCFFL